MFQAENVHDGSNVAGSFAEVVGLIIAPYLLLTDGRRLLSNLFLETETSSNGKTAKEIGSAAFTSPRALSVLRQVDASLNIIAFTIAIVYMVYWKLSGSSLENRSGSRILALLTSHVLYEFTKPRVPGDSTSSTDISSSKASAGTRLPSQWKHYIADAEKFITVAFLATLYNGQFTGETSSLEWKFFSAWLAYRWAIAMYACRAEGIYRIKVLGGTENDGVRLHDENIRVRSDLWCIHGELYDMKDFVDQHPGGKEAIMLGQGRDASYLYESYHAFASPEKMRAILKKYKVRDYEGKPPPPPPPKDLFYEVLKERVAKTLREQGLDPILDRGATPFRAVYCIAAIACLIASAVAHTRGSILGSFLMGAFGWIVGCIGHDGGHFAVSHSVPAINDWALWCISLLENPFLWTAQHTYAHHSHTNSFDHDPDLHHFTKLLRYHPRHIHEPQYIMQRSRYFITWAFTLICFGTCLLVPIGMGLEGTVHHCVEFTDRKRPIRYLGFLLHYAIYLGWIVIWPFYLHETCLAAMAAVALNMGTCSFLFGAFSQIGHINEVSMAAALKPDSKKTETNKEEDEKLDPVRASLSSSWAVRQIQTSNNFCTQSTFWFCMSNGLNFQIEHHLFPGFNTCHLHRIQPVVEATCHEYGVDYKNYVSWMAIMNATMEYLTRLSGVEHGMLQSTENQ